MKRVNCLNLEERERECTANREPLGWQDEIFVRRFFDRLDHLHKKILRERKRINAVYSDPKFSDWYKTAAIRKTEKRLDILEAFANELMHNIQLRLIQAREIMQLQARRQS